MEKLPVYIPLLFILTTFLSIWYFYKATGNSNKILLILVLWVVAQGFTAASGFYLITDKMPPRFLLLALPPVIVIVLLFLTVPGRSFLDSLDKRSLTLLHVVRLPVEIVLYCLFLNKAIPELMTFEGRNPDILCGFSAPLVYYLYFIKKQMGRGAFLIWNLACLALLLNIVVNAVLSVQSPFQLFAFHQPNIAVLYFPYNWLPAIIVPLVLLSHLAVIRQLTNKLPLSDTTLA